MANLVPLDKARHSGKGWLRPIGYNVRCRETLWRPSALLNSPHAVPALPIGFIERGGHYFPVALMGLTKGTNLFVGPAGNG